MEVLEETEQFVYYREKGKLLGFAGYSNRNSKRHKLRKRFYTFIKNKLYKSKKIKDLNSLREYEITNENMQTRYINMTSNTELFSIIANTSNADYVNLKDKTGYIK